MSQITRFDNGVRLVTEHVPSTLSATIGIWVGRGARHEMPEQNGIAHFLEHMAFKGTSSRNALDIAEAIEDVGGYLNAYTAKDVTAYYSRVLGADVPLAMDVLGDILLNPSFDQKEIEVERGVILQEIGQTLDTPDDIIFDWLSEASYPDQALGRPILGSADLVRSYHADDFRGFIGGNYGGENLVISASGDVDHDALAKMIEAQFSTLCYQSEKAQEKADFASGQQRIKKRLEQAHFAMALPAPSLEDDDHYAAQLLSSILGGGMSSRLFQSIREERGLCYTIFSSLNMLQDVGQLVIYAGTSAKGIDPLMRETARELKRFANTIEERELERAKAQLRAGSVMALEQASARAERNARQMLLFDKLIAIEDSLAKIDAVSRDDLAKLAQKLFSQAPQMVVYGPIGKALDFDGFMAELA